MHLIAFDFFLNTAKILVRIAGPLVTPLPRRVVWSEWRLLWWCHHVRLWRILWVSVFSLSFIVDLQLNINCLELLTVIVCLKLWVTRLRGRHIFISCDNLVSVTVINSGRTRDNLPWVSEVSSAHKIKNKCPALTSDKQRLIGCQKHSSNTITRHEMLKPVSHWAATARD